MADPALRERTGFPLAGDDMALLVFQLESHRFGLIADLVREIVRAVAIAALPHAPPIVEGIINYRGSIVPVLDVRERFHLPAVPLHPDQHFIIAQAGPRLVGLRVDRAAEFVRVSRSAIEPASRLVAGLQYTAGVVKLPDGLLVIHDLERFLALEEASQLDRAMSGAHGTTRKPKARGSA